MEQKPSSQPKQNVPHEPLPSFESSGSSTATQASPVARAPPTASPTAQPSSRPASASSPSQQTNPATRAQPSFTQPQQARPVSSQQPIQAQGAHPAASSTVTASTTKTQREEKKTPGEVLLDKYAIEINKVVVTISIKSIDADSVPHYDISIANISETTKLILEKIRQEFISKASVDQVIQGEENQDVDKIRDSFKKEISQLITTYFPTTTQSVKDMLINYLMEENLGLGKIEILLKDPHLEEIVINNHDEPVWCYHRKFGWLKTNISLPSESRIRHYATIIGRDVGKEITTLNPLMDAHLSTGDRVNATLEPISTKGNTITIRKFSDVPWTVTRFIKAGTLSLQAAAFIWLAMQNELSILVGGGTGSGKTSMLNAIGNFFPPNQRIISIEDTRELTLPRNLHWVPLETRLPNPEGKGGISMLDLLVNSLRMRPDRILVGEIRRKREAEVLLEAMHTGHSVYATIHANNADEVVMRLTNPPIDIPKPMIASLGLIVIQNRNRRTGKRRTMQVAEVLETGDENVLLQLNAHDDHMERVNDSRSVLEKLELYTGLNKQEIDDDLRKKIKILHWMLKNGIEDVHDVGMVMAKYYLGRLVIH
ncbi:MAG: Flp pilus assembly complex ATPase component TadA [Candidatus Woesearchaeota archaeon]|nr:MAG: Flp pilus assembly complex ATPase component TadA [Candidatus Woesearchaeota archaeon]